MVPLSMIDLLPGIQGHAIFEVEYWKKWHVLKTKILFHTNRKLYLTMEWYYGLVTLTDL